MKNLIMVFGVSAVNAVAVVILFYIVGASLHAVTKQFLDQINFSSIVTFLACLGLLCFLCRLEARRWGFNFVVVLATSIGILVIMGLGMAHAVNVIAGRIG